MMAAARNVVRRSFTAPVRIALLEEDADIIESTLETAVADMKTFVAGEVNRLRGTMRWLIGSFFAVVLAIISALAVVAFK